jgi:CYTH domain-containing protein
MKYTRVEYERRFLVSPSSDWRSFVEPYSKTLTDTYVRQTRLRLRALVDSDSERQVFKLTKKLGSDSPYFQTIGSMILSASEFELLSNLEGDGLRKVRYYHRRDDQVFSVDEFRDELTGLVLCEVEAKDLDELMRIQPPEYAGVEVTEDRFFTGGNLCRTTRAEMLRKLTTVSRAG